MANTWIFWIKGNAAYTCPYALSFPVSLIYWNYSILSKGNRQTIVHILSPFSFGYKDNHPFFVSLSNWIHSLIYTSSQSLSNYHCIQMVPVSLRVTYCKCLSLEVQSSDQVDETLRLFDRLCIGLWHISRLYPRSALKNRSDRKAWWPNLAWYIRYIQPRKTRTAQMPSRHILWL